MSNQLSVTEQLVGCLKKTQAKFSELNKANGELVDFGQECLFARQQVLKNEFTLKTASKNPDSLQAAILNVSAIGISLNPANNHAYLVPRGNEICLDISYRGLVKLATDCGAISWAKVELVYENDDFKWRGPAEQPHHEADPFGDRGKIKGGYCIAKLPSGEILTEVMPIAEIEKVKATSKSRTGPWTTWFEEMAKKTILKRASKSWPQTPARGRIDEAVNVLHQTEGTAYTLEEHSEFMSLLHNKEALKFYMMRHRLGDDKWIALYNSFDKGQKVAGKEKASELEKEGIAQLQAYSEQITEAMGNDDSMALKQIEEELTAEEREFIQSYIDSH